MIFLTRSNIGSRAKTSLFFKIAWLRPGPRFSHSIALTIVRTRSKRRTARSEVCLTTTRARQTRAQFGAFLVKTLFNKNNVFTRLPMIRSILFASHRSPALRTRCSRSPDPLVITQTLTLACVFSLRSSVRHSSHIVSSLKPSRVCSSHARTYRTSQATRSLE